jgi:23S rRNA pseudouridine2457 synthase
VQVEGLFLNQVSMLSSSWIPYPSRVRPATAKSSLTGFHPASRRRNYHPTSWLRITLQEGKKHQVRRMTAAAGYPTLRLVRFSIGSITIEGLEPGQWRHLSTGELKPCTRNCIFLSRIEEFTPFYYW